MDNVVGSGPKTIGSGSGAEGWDQSGKPLQVRQPRPLQVQGHYPVPRMIYLTISTEDLAGIAVSSGIGSLALSGTLFFAKEAYAANWPPPMMVGLVFFGAMTLAAYLFLGGLVVRIRRRSNLSWWNIFGE